MKGVEIKFSTKTINIAQEFWTSVMIYCRNGRYYIEAGGLDGNISYRWIDSEIELGEIIEIEIKDIDKSSEPILKETAFSNPNIVTDPSEIEAINAEQLAYFFALEKILKKEKLL